MAPILIDDAWLRNDIDSFMWAMNWLVLVPLLIFVCVAPILDRAYRKLRAIHFWWYYSVWFGFERNLF